VTGSAGSESVARAFALLGVSPEASRQELRLAFAARCRLFHPDRHATADDEMRAAATDRMREVNEAYAVARRALRDREVDLRTGVVERRPIASTSLALGRSTAIVSAAHATNPWLRATKPTPLLGWVFDAVA